MKHIKEFKKLVEKGQYYDAHEVLEEIWFPIRKRKNDCALVLKGFINSAVSLELYKRGKVEQSKKVYKNYIKYVTTNRIIKTDNYIAFIELKKDIDRYFSQLDIK